jgi:hypothetical protein
MSRKNDFLKIDNFYQADKCQIARLTIERQQHNGLLLKKQRVNHGAAARERDASF